MCPLQQCSTIKNNLTGLSNRTQSNLGCIAQPFPEYNRIANLQPSASPYMAVFNRFPDITNPIFRERPVRHSVTQHIATRGPPLNAESAVSHRTGTSKRKTNLSICSIWGLSEDLPVIGPLLFTWCLRKSPEIGGLAGTIEC